MSYIIILWLGFSFVVPPFFILLFLFIALIPQSFNTLKLLFVYTIIVIFILLLWNYEMHNAYLEHVEQQLDDFADLSLAIARIFTFLLNCSVIIGIITRLVQLLIKIHRKRKRIRFIRQYHMSKRRV